MASAIAPNNPIANWKEIRDEWIARLDELVTNVENWGQEIGWATKRIEKQMEDDCIGSYPAPALLMQENFTRVLLEPIARFIAGGPEGEADLYRMPAYDDIARMFYSKGGWHMIDASAPDLEREAPKPVSKKSIQEFLQGLKKDGA